MKQAVLALAIAALTATAHGEPLAPTLIFDADYRADPHTAVEGFDGLTLVRMQAGARGDLSPNVSVAGLVDFASGESPAIIDAWVSWRAFPGLELSGGYLRSPLFPSARDEFVERLPIPELGVLAHALWPGRAVGVSARWRPPALPIDVWIRAGNGSSFTSGNDTNYPALDERIDYVYGRARSELNYGSLRPTSTRDALWGIRVGVGAHVDNVDDQPGAAGYTASGYEFYRPAVVSGDRHVFEGHALVQYDAVQLSIEAGYAKEDRSQNVSGNPADRVGLAGIQSYGIAGEVAWMLTGDHRVAGAWPLDTKLAHTLGAVEVAGRFERVRFGRCATATTECTGTVEKLDANIASAAVHWWIRPQVATALAGYYYRWDADPYDQPQVRSSWLILARLTLSIR